ncbi:putative Kelch-like protein 7 [Polypedilum vanderplanki]|uniref:Kelch-like protein 7 n=1 Tax=Polypedilum vanderplanki TaxID=319348 RepID=A0A9J6BK65_POLVA|nr:putative Kelch-like protein 7 [Polypedilum vanderplanki]
MTSVFLIKLDGSQEKLKYSFQKIYKQKDFGTWTISITATPKEFSGMVNLTPNNFNTYIYADQIQIKTIIRELKNNNPERLEEKYRAIEIKAKLHSELIYIFDFKYFVKNSPSLYIPKSLILMIEIPAIPFVLNTKEIQKLKSICDKKINCDVTLMVRDKELKAHKAVLEKCKVFKKMFEENPDVIQINDVDYDVLIEMCRFLYCNEIFYKNILTLKLIVAAKNYMITDLVQKCEEYLIDHIDFYNVINILIQADALKMDRMRNAAIEFIIINREIIYLTQDWSEFEKNHKALVLLIGEKIICKVT